MLWWPRREAADVRACKEAVAAVVRVFKAAAVGVVGPRRTAVVCVRARRRRPGSGGVRWRRSRWWATGGDLQPVVAVVVWKRRRRVVHGGAWRGRPVGVGSCSATMGCGYGPRCLADSCGSHVKVVAGEGGSGAPAARVTGTPGTCVAGLPAACAAGTSTAHIAAAGDGGDACG
ncbi:hypothetical protein ACP70R_016283 [Stipagrostis hirtigluma subsp. patula]